MRVEGIATIRGGQPVPRRLLDSLLEQALCGRTRRSEGPAPPFPERAHWKCSLRKHAPEWWPTISPSGTGIAGTRSRENRRREFDRGKRSWSSSAWMDLSFPLEDPLPHAGSGPVLPGGADPRDPVRVSEAKAAEGIGERHQASAAAQASGCRPPLADDPIRSRPPHPPPTKRELNNLNTRSAAVRHFCCNQTCDFSEAMRQWPFGADERRGRSVCSPAPSCGGRTRHYSSKPGGDESAAGATACDSDCPTVGHADPRGDPSTCKRHCPATKCKEIAPGMAVALR